MTTAQEVIVQVAQLNDVEFDRFKALFKRQIERRSLILLDTFILGDIVTFTARDAVVVAKVSKVAIKNLKVVELTVDGVKPTFPKGWTVPPSCCKKVQA